MRILSNGKVDVDKQTIYLDVDDVVLNSRSTAVKIFRERYGGGGEERREERSWTFKTTRRGISQDEIIQVFDSEEFWSRVHYKDDFMVPFMEEIVIPWRYNVTLVTKGDEGNIKRKWDMLSGRFDFDRVGFLALDNDESKSRVHMWEGIQIDDNYENLRDTDARVKILYREVDDSDYNGFWRVRDNLSRLYVCSMADEIMDVLRFNLEIQL